MIIPAFEAFDQHGIFLGWVQDHGTVRAWKQARTWWGNKVKFLVPSLMEPTE